MVVFLGWFLFAIAFINLALLSFAFRDFSFPLVLQFIVTAVGLPIGTYILYTYYHPEPDVVFVTEDKETGKLYEDEEEIDNQVNGFFNSCR